MTEFTEMETSEIEEMLEQAVNKYGMEGLPHILNTQTYFYSNLLKRY